MVLLLFVTFPSQQFSRCKVDILVASAACHAYMEGTQDNPGQMVIAAGPRKMAIPNCIYILQHLHHDFNSLFFIDVPPERGRRCNAHLSEKSTHKFL